MPKTIYSPAEWVIEQCGGIRELARILEMAPSSVSNWKKSGLVPAIHHRDVIHWARKSALDIKPEDLVFGRTVKIGKR